MPNDPCSVNDVAVLLRKTAAHVPCGFLYVGKVYIHMVPAESVDINAG